jgi:HEAT repeat protein
MDIIIIEQLIDNLTSTNGEIRASAAHQLVQMGGEAVEPLIETVRQGSGKQSWRALKVLTSIPDRVFDVLCEAVTAAHPIVRETAAAELGKTGDPRALPLLVTALDDTHPNVQLWAAQALRDLGDPQAVSTLLERLPQVVSASMRYTIIEALGVLGDASIIPSILPYRDDPDHHVRDRVQAALKKLNQTV